MPSSTRQRRGAAARPRKASRPNPALVYLDNLAPTGRRSVQHQLAKALVCLGRSESIESCNWAKIGYEDLVTVKTKLIGNGYAPATVNLTMAALKGVLKCAFHLDLVDADRVLRASAVKAVRHHTEPRGRSLSGRQNLKLLSTVLRDRSTKGRRDAALIALMAVTGLRRTEVIGLQLEDLNPTYRELFMHQGKGNRDRICPLPLAVRKLVVRWLQVRGKAPGPLFCPVDRYDQVSLRGLSGQGLYVIVANRAAAAGVGHLTPHDLRRTFVTRLLESGVDLHQVSQMIGHSDVSVTSRYDKRSCDARRLVSRLL